MITIKKIGLIGIGLLIGSSIFVNWSFCGGPSDAKGTADWKPQPWPEKVKSSSWSKVQPGKGNEGLKLQRIAVGDVNHVWAIGEPQSGKDNAQIYQLGRASEKEDEQWIPKTEGIDVSVGEDGTVVIVKNVDGKHKVFKLKHEKEKELWDPLFPDNELTRVFVSSADVVWGVLKDGDTYKAYKMKDGKLEALKTMNNEDATGFVLFSIAEDEHGEDVVLGVDEHGTLYRYDGELANKYHETAELRKSKKFKEHMEKHKQNQRKMHKKEAGAKKPKTEKPKKEKAKKEKAKKHKKKKDTKAQDASKKEKKGKHKKHKHKKKHKAEAAKKAQETQSEPAQK